MEQQRAPSWCDFGFAWRRMVQFHEPNVNMHVKCMFIYNSGVRDVLPRNRRLPASRAGPHDHPLPASALRKDYYDFCRFPPLY